MAFVIPFIEMPSVYSNMVTPEENPVIHWLSESNHSLDQWAVVPVQNESLFTWWMILPLSYLLVMIVLLVRFVISILALQQYKKHTNPIRKRWFKLYKTTHGRPFSFFSNVFIPGWLFGSDAFEPILSHECVHVKQLHSLDRLLLDFVVSLFWFNPFIYLYRNALIEIHEYQADAAVIHRFKDPVGYQEILFSQLQTASHSGLVSHFNVEMIKKRIVMMNKPNKMSRWVYGLTAPVVLLIVFAFSSKDAKQPLQKMEKEITAFIGPLDDFKEITSNWIPNDVYTPSILPLKNTEKIRLSSKFGKRYNPIDKKEQHHRGVDFATPSGNPILATANGVVKSAKNDGNYGLRIILQHGEEFSTAYAHLSKLSVKKGETVTKGQEIGLSGNTGLSTAPHLHYEVLKNGKVTDPLAYIGNYTFEKKKEEKKTGYLNNEVPNEQKAYRIIIDPGHGGEDDGAASPSGELEKTFALNIAKAIKTSFEDSNYEIVLTRDEDTQIGLADRATLSNGADLFISIHSNNAPVEVQGRFIQPIYFEGNQYTEASKKLAQLITAEFEAIGKSTKIGFTDGFKVLKDAQCPAVILNVGFISNPDDVKYLNSKKGQKEIVTEISDAIKLAVL